MSDTTIKDLAEGLEKAFVGLDAKLTELLTKSDDDAGDKDTKKRVRLEKDEDADDKTAKAKAKADACATDDEEEDPAAKKTPPWVKGEKADKDAKKADDAGDKVAKATDKDAKVEKAADAEVEKGVDETVTVDGTLISKHAVGAAQFEVFKTLAAKIEKGATELQAERDLRKQAQFEKSADELFKHIPGSVSERGQMLKAIDGMKPELKGAFEKVFKQSEALAKMAFQTIGKAPGVGVEKSADPKAFMGKVAEIQTRDKVSKNAAMEKAAIEFPVEFEAMQAAARAQAGQ